LLAAHVLIETGAGVTDSLWLREVCRGGSVQSAVQLHASVAGACWPGWSKGKHTTIRVHLLAYLALSHKPIDGMACDNCRFMILQVVAQQCQAAEAADWGSPGGR
jgi:hypothetical protein